MDIRTDKVIHYQREFLAPEQTRYDYGNCQSYVYLEKFSGDDESYFLEAELRIADWTQAVSFDASQYDEENYEAYLAMITALMNHVIAYRQAFAEGLALLRGQATTRGGYVVEMTVDGSKMSEGK